MSSGAIRSPDDLSSGPVTLSRDSAAMRSEPSRWPTPGVAFGRYALLRPLGRGGMGEVWAGWDDKLAREVAIKIVRAADAQAAGLHADRLAREARALARLSDPHVVQVYDVGSYDTRTDEGVAVHGVFVVMELVQGVSLGEWLRQPRTPTEIVDVFVEAGRGIAAAHAAGLVHRDVKPSNMFVGGSPLGVGEGRVRIGDFGLARASTSGPRGEGGAPATGESGVNLGDETLIGSLTETGAVVGTPLYMAPEQHAGAVVDARSDQYAFCVALYEALHRVRPFDGPMPVMAVAKSQRRVREHVRDGISTALHEIVWRGLAPEPADRWPDMPTLLGALERAVRPRHRRRWPIIVAGGLGLALAAALLRSGADERCTPVAGALWTSERRSALEGMGNAPLLLGSYVDELERLQAEMCVEPAQHVAELQCIRRAGAELEAILVVLDEPERGLADLSQMIDGLPNVDACRAAATVPAPAVAEADRAAVDGAMIELARGEALWRSERHSEALAIGESVLVVVEAGRVPVVPVRAAAQLLVGKANEGLAALADAEHALTDAYFGAAAHGDADTAFEASRMLAMAMVERQRRREAETWLRHAEVEYERLAPTAVLAARRANARSAVLIMQGQFESAAVELRAAMQRCAPGECATWESLAVNLALVLERQGKFGEAHELHLSTLRDLEERFGVDSPATILLRLALVSDHLVEERFDEAELELGEAERLIDGWTQPKQRVRFIAARYRSEILMARGDTTAAVALLERSVAMADAVLAPDDLRRANHLNDLASAYFAAGRPADALATYAKARELTERADPSSFEHGALLVSMGYTRGEMGDYDGALADLRAGRALLLPLVGAEHPGAVQALINEANVLGAAKRWREALPRWQEVARGFADRPAGASERVLAELAVIECRIELGEHEAALVELDRLVGVTLEDPEQEVQADVLRARALWFTDRRAAVALAERVRESMRAAKMETGEIDTWLAEH